MDDIAARPSRRNNSDVRADLIGASLEWKPDGDGWRLFSGRRRERGRCRRLEANVWQRKTSLGDGSKSILKSRWRCTRSFTSWRCASSSILGAQRAAAASHKPRCPPPSARLSGTWAEHFFSAKPSIALTGLGRAIRPYLEEIARNADGAREAARALATTPSLPSKS